MRIVLGSKSASRRLLLARLTREFETASAEIDEQAIRSTDYELLPLLLARAKADALLPQMPKDALLVTSDQVVVCNGELREKPASAAEAQRWLESYARYPAQTNTAVVVHNVATGLRVEGIDIARAYYCPIPEEVSQQLIAQGDIFAAAGGFLIEDPLLEPYLDRIEGEKESIMGLPIALTARLLDQASRTETT